MGHWALGGERRAGVTGARCHSADSRGISGLIPAQRREEGEEAWRKAGRHVTHCQWGITPRPPAPQGHPVAMGRAPLPRWLQPRSEQAASSDAAGLLRSQPAAASGPEPVWPGAGNYFDTSNVYVSDITKEVRAWRSQGRNAGLSLSCRMCVTQSLFSARLIFNFL